MYIIKQKELHKGGFKCITVFSKPCLIYFNLKLLNLSIFWQKSLKNQSLNPHNLEVVIYFFESCWMVCMVLFENEGLNLHVFTGVEVLRETFVYPFLRWNLRKWSRSTMAEVTHEGVSSSGTPFSGGTLFGCFWKSCEGMNK